MTAYPVRQREREISIRTALGATGPLVVWMFVKERALLILVGLGAGLAASTMVGRLLEHQLYGVTRFDFPTLLGDLRPYDRSRLARQLAPRKTRSHDDAGVRAAR